MTPELLQTIVQLGGFGVAVWMLNNVWSELKVQNERIFALLTNLEAEHRQNQSIAKQVGADITK